MSYIKTGDIENKISSRSLNNGTVREGWNDGRLKVIRKDLRGLEFWDLVQRRGVDVNTPKIGSRDGEKCSGGIWGFYAELRRESFGGNLNLAIF
jgi:hypothetical protein